MASKMSRHQARRKFHISYQRWKELRDAGGIEEWDDAVQLVEVWMDFYNSQRAHSGHVNRGLPPTAFYGLYQKTPGDHLDRLLALGVIKPGPGWRIRLGQLPYALVLDRTGTEFTPAADVDKTHAVTEPANGGRGRVTLSK